MICFNRTAGQAQSPYRGSKGAAGIDLPLPHTVTIGAGKKVCLDLYLEVNLPPGHFGLLALRSGAARRHSLVLHGGIIGRCSRSPCSMSHRLSSLPDADYRGNLILVLENRSDEPLELRSGTAYAQLIPVKYCAGPLLGGRDFVVFTSERETSGFGSTETRIRVEQIFAEHLEPEDESAVGAEVAEAVAEAALPEDEVDK